MSINCWIRLLLELEELKTELKIRNIMNMTSITPPIIHPTFEDDVGVGVPVAVCPASVRAAGCGAY